MLLRVLYLWYESIAHSYALFMHLFTITYTLHKYDGVNLGVITLQKKYRKEIWWTLESELEQTVLLNCGHRLSHKLYKLVLLKKVLKEWDITQRRVEVLPKSEIFLLLSCFSITRILGFQRYWLYSSSFRFIFQNIFVLILYPAGKYALFSAVRGANRSY